MIELARSTWYVSDGEIPSRIELFEHSHGKDTRYGTAVVILTEATDPNDLNSTEELREQESRVWGHYDMPLDIAIDDFAMRLKDLSLNRERVKEASEL
jgi:hypothetical protein